MSDDNGDGRHKTAAELPVGRPFVAGHDGRRNAGGRPRGLAATARAAVGDDASDLIAFFSAIMRGDRTFLSERRPIALRDRMQAAMWLADRGWGKAVAVVELPDTTAELFTVEQRAELRDLPEDLKDGIRRWLRERSAAYFAQQREEADRRMRSFLPTAAPDTSGDGPVG